MYTPADEVPMYSSVYWVYQREHYDTQPLPRTLHDVSMLYSHTTCGQYRVHPCTVLSKTCFQLHRTMWHSR
jgi:hypothetical protein